MDITEIVEGRKDWGGTPDPAALHRRERLLDGMNLDDQRMLTNMIGTARAGREALLKDFAHSLYDLLMTESRVGTTLRPQRLLEYAARPGDLLMDRRLHFEAVSLFDLALLQKWVEQQPSQSRYAVGEDMSNLLDRMIDTFFTREAVDTQVRTCHDPDDRFRVSAVAFNDEPLDGPPEYIHTHWMTFRLAQHDLPVMVDHRPKGLFETVLKMLKQRAEGVADWHKVYDRRGFRMVVRAADDISRLFDALATFAELIGAEFVRIGGNVMDTTGRMKPDNRQSTDRFRAAKVRIVLKDQPYEIQAMTVRDYVSSRSALGPENHELYRLRQLRDCYGELLWPEAIYGVDWSVEAAENGPLYEQALARLNWRAVRRR